jgi:WD40 repeat protein
MCVPPSRTFVGQDNKHKPLCCIDSNSKYLISGGASGEVFVWELWNDRSTSLASYRGISPVKSFKIHAFPVSAICLSEDDTLFASADTSGTIYIFGVF